MAGLILRIAREYGARAWVKDGNVYAVKGEVGEGEGYPVVVAHTDTVHDIIPDDRYRVSFSRGAYYAWDSETFGTVGIGGDDKVGIYVALYALRKMPAVKLFFPRDEEIGCVGTSMADMTFFDDAAYVLQCDRRGNNDFVQRACAVDLYGDEFAAAIAPLLDAYRYRPNQFGGMTDVMRLKENGLSVAAANMSCGYYLPHSDQEWVSRRDMERCQALVLRIIRSLGTSRFEHVHVPKVYHFAPATKSWPKLGTRALWDWDDDEDWERLKKQAVSTGNMPPALPSGNLTGMTPIEAESVCPVCHTESYDYDPDAALWFCMPCDEYIPKRARCVGYSVDYECDDPPMTGSKFCAVCRSIILARAERLIGEADEEERMVTADGSTWRIVDAGRFVGLADREQGG